MDVFTACPARAYRPRHRHRTLTTLRKTLSLSLVPIALLAPAHGLAQGRWYEVEVIIFQQPEPGGADREWWPARQPLPAAQRLDGLSRASGKTALRTLGGGEMELGNLRAGLDRAPGYRVLEHFGWVQPDWEEGEALAVALPLNWAAPSEPENPFVAVPTGSRLYGSLRVYISRYAHILTDLRFDPEGRPAVPPLAALPTNDPVTGLPTYAPVAEDGPPVYAMTQSRRMRSAEIHYLDHPVLGVLVEVRRLEEGREDAQ